MTELGTATVGSRMPIMTPMAAMVPGPLIRRFGARIVDGIILGIATAPIKIVLEGGQVYSSSVFSNSGMAPAMTLMALNVVFSLVVTMFYYCWFYAKKGGTPGKLLLKLKVVDHQTGSHLTPGKTILRETIGQWIFGFGLLLLGLTVWLARARDDRRTVADLIANSQVLFNKKA